MIVCSCHAIRDRDIDRLVVKGCRTVADIGRACGAGTDCGSCVSELRDRMARVRKDAAEPLIAMAVAAK